MADTTTDAAVEQLGSGPVPAEVEQPEVKEQTETTEPETKGDETDTAVEHPQRRKGGWQRKIEKLEQEVELWREQALKTQSSSQTDKTPTGPAKPTPPKLSTFQGTAEDFDKAQDKYEKDLEAFHTQQAQQRVVAQKAEQATNNVLTQLKSMDDYEAIDEAAQEYLPNELVKPLASECAFFKNGAEVFRSLVMDPEERESLLQMLEMNDILGIKTQVRALSIALRKSETVAAPKPTTRAPKPPTPVTKPAPSGHGPDGPADINEWVKWREGNAK